MVGRGDAESVTDRPARAGTAVVTGFLTGTAAGLIGVGGGEFRLPVLVSLLGFPLKLAASANLLIGLVTVVVSAVLRLGGHRWAHEDLVLLGVMAFASVIGAALGCLLRTRLRFRLFTAVVCTYLVLVGAWMLYEGLARVEHTLFHPSGVGRAALAAAGGFLVAVASGALGVAGGELRIPMLLYLFGVPVRDAGTLSLAVSIPTIAAGVVTDWHRDRPPAWALRTAGWMGGASIAGAFTGAALLPLVDRDTLDTLLGLVLVLATVRMTTAVER